MHLPPAAQVVTGRSRSHLYFLVGWAVVYVCVFAALSGSIAPLELTGIMLVCTAIGTHAAWRWWRSPSGILAWTGRQWIWKQQTKQECTVRWAVDLQTIVLLKLKTKQGQRQWLWVERGANSAASWLAFRRALVAGNKVLDENGDDDADFSSDYLIPAQQPHIQAGSAAHSVIRRIPGIQNSTER